jgi:hypothetical protein
VAAGAHLSHSMQEAEDEEIRHKALLQMVNTREVEVEAMEVGAIEAMAEGAAAEDLVEDVDARRK